mgnify:CR=1 FL=1
MSLKKGLALVVLLLPGIVLGKATESLYPGKYKTQKHDFVTNLYLQIYLETHHESAEEIIGRLNQRNLEAELGMPLQPAAVSAGDDEETALTEEEQSQEQSAQVLNHWTVDNYCQMDVPEKSKTLALSIDQHDFVAGKLREFCEQERSFLREENNIARRTGLRSMFVNGHLGDGPFDLVSDMNDLDVIFFGEKHEIPDPSFPKPQSGWTEGASDLVLGEFSSERESDPVAWMNQRSDLFDYDEQPKYSEEDNSIMSHMHNLLRPLNELELYSLAAGCHARRTLEPTFFPKIPGTGKLSVMHNLGEPVHVYSVPITKNRTLDRGHEKEGWGETPTDFIDQELPLMQFLTLENLLLDQPSCIKRIKNFGGIDYSLGIDDFIKDQDRCNKEDLARYVFQYRQQEQKRELDIMERDHSQEFRQMRRLREEIEAFFSLTTSVEAIMGKLSKTTIIQ